MNAPYHRTVPRLTPVREPIDWDAINRLSDFARRAREEMGEARWADLQAEWEA